MTHDNEFQPKELHTRFLYPFFVQQTDLDQALGALQALTSVARKGGASVWEMSDAHEFYRQESLDHVSAYLFPEKEHQDLACCRYLKVAEDRINAWFRKGVSVRGPKGDAFTVVLAPGVGIELFLSPYGVGLLSITLMTEASQWGEAGLGMEQVKRFNYLLSQLERQRTAPALAIPYPQKRPGAEIPPPPDRNAPFSERLGKAGGEFALGELVNFLLGPLKETGSLQPAQQQFSVYTVVRFGKEVDFAQAAVREQLGAWLAGLAQVEEATHVGAVPGEMLDIVNHVMNTRHWAGVSFLGAAHLVADQDPSHPFDEQRLPTIRDKYFIPYLVAFQQRLTLHSMIGRASATVRSSSRADRAGQFHRFHMELLDFTATGYFTEISSREALNRFYRMTQQGQGVERALERVTQTIYNHHSDKLTDDVNRNVETVSQVQRKVEWLEVFFVSFYAAELSHIVSDNFFVHNFTAYSTLFWSLFAGLLALWGLQPWQTEHRAGKNTWMFIVTLLVVAIAVWFSWGFSSWSKHGHEEDSNSTAHVPTVVEQGQDKPDSSHSPTDSP